MNIIDESVSAECERIKNSVIYIDWNIYSYLSGLSDNSSDIQSKSLCFLQTILRFIDLAHTCFPYSDFHFRDIMLGDESYYTSKVDFLSEQTKGWRIHEDKINNKQVRIDKTIDMNEHFLQYSKTAKFNTNPLVLSNELIQNLKNAVSPNDDFQKFRIEVIKILESNSDPAGLTILKVNKKMRNMNIKKNKNNVRFPSLNKDVLKDDIDLKKVVMEEIKLSNFNYSIIENMYGFIEEITSPFISEFTREVMKLASLCDLIGLSNEKLSKQTSFDGIINDMSHLSLGLRSHVFITEDHNLRLKALFIKKWLSLPVLIYDMDSFIEAVLKQTFKNEKKPICIKFSDSTKVIRSYNL